MEDENVLSVDLGRELMTSTLPQLVELVEKHLTIAAMREARGNRARAAVIAGVTRRSMRYLVDKHCPNFQWEV